MGHLTTFLNPMPQSPCDRCGKPLNEAPQFRLTQDMSKAVYVCLSCMTPEERESKGEQRTKDEPDRLIRP